MKRYVSLFGSAAASSVILLFFAAFCARDKVTVAFSMLGTLVKQTLLGIHIPINYYGVEPQQYWYSIRLILASVLIALLLGIVLALLRLRASRLVKVVVEIPFTLLEAIPEPLYVVLAVLVLLFFLNHLQVVLPAFPDGPPSWQDTLFPSMVLGLPAAFYVSRILQVNTRNELGAQYVVTGQSKGLSRRQVFYGHVMANVTPTFLLQISVVFTMVVSSLMFTEYMMSYQGALFGLAEYGFLGIQRPRAVPMYEPGLIWAVGSFLIGMWLLGALLSRLWFDLRYPADIEIAPAPQMTKMETPWIYSGAVLIGLVILFSVFPHLLTQNGPNQRHLVNLKTDTGSPFPPNHLFPLGTDYLGRDLLARALQATKTTLTYTIGIVSAITGLSLLLSALATINRKGWLANFIGSVGHIFASLPILIVVMLTLRSRSVHSPHQELEYIAWIVVFEAGRGTAVFLQTYERWYQYKFVEGALSVGRSSFTILFVHFRKWLQQFTLEFFFSELSRVLSLMTVLAVFQIYPVAAMGYPEFFDSVVPVIISVQNTWFSMIGDITSAGSYLHQEYFFYAPVACLLFVAIGANLVAKGLRGKEVT